MLRSEDWEVRGYWRLVFLLLFVNVWLFFVRDDSLCHVWLRITALSARNITPILSYLMNFLFGWPSDLRVLFLLRMM